jgi:hypothetical protein
MIFCLTPLIWIVGSGMHLNRAIQPINNDFSVYYRTAMRLSTPNADLIYSLEDGSMPFRYTPVVLPFFAPLALLNEVTARRTWFFIQIAFFLSGFYLMYLTLRELQCTSAALYTCLSFLMVSRYYLDSLLCGQISGMLFALYGLGLLLCVRGKTIRSGLICLIPTAFKLGPGIIAVFLWIKADVQRRSLLFLLSLAGAFLILNAMAQLLLPPQHSVFELWQQWFTVVGHDADYFDGSTTRSQCIRAFLLRALGSTKNSEGLWDLSVALMTVGLITLWAVCRPKAGTLAAKKATAWGYCLGLIAIVLLMPQSLPYSLVHLAFPVALVWLDLQRRASPFSLRLSAMVLILFTLVCSVPGSSVVGFVWADEIQRLSLPVGAISILLIYGIRQFIIASRWET